METYFNLDVVKVIGLLLAAVAVITIIFSSVLVIYFRKNNKLNIPRSSKSEDKKQFELLTPVLLQRIENITKIVEEKRHVQVIKTEPETKSEVKDNSNYEKEEDVVQDGDESKIENEADAKEEQQRDISERYKIENRFIRNPKTS
jgi:hypothetical protein